MFEVSGSLDSFSRVCAYLSPSVVAYPNNAGFLNRDHPDTIMIRVDRLGRPYLELSPE